MRAAFADETGTTQVEAYHLGPAVPGRGAAVSQKIVDERLNAIRRPRRMNVDIVRSS